MFGPMRKVQFKVRDCTDYMNRTLPTRRQMEDIALIIPTEPARRRAGFNGVGFSNESEEEDVVVNMEQISPVAKARDTSRVTGSNPAMVAKPCSSDWIEQPLSRQFPRRNNMFLAIPLCKMMSSCGPTTNDRGLMF